MHFILDIYPCHKYSDTKSIYRSTLLSIAAAALPTKMHVTFYTIAVSTTAVAAEVVHSAADLS